MEYAGGFRFYSVWFSEIAEDGLVKIGEHGWFLSD